MAKFTAESFTTNLMAITVGGIVFGSVAVPIFLDVAKTEGLDGPTKTIVTVIPVFLGIGLLLGCIYLFINRSKSN